jgi:23S rRNA pseudouridine2605 synthase
MSSKTTSTGTRIQKYLSECGVCSRREAERWIREGLIKINGHVAEIGQKIDPEKDFVKLRNKPLNKLPQKKIVLAMNKPKGTLCSNNDPYDSAQTVFALLPSNYRKKKLFCAGRLDKDSEGLLILTNDGEFSNNLTHPSSEIVKRYHVTLNKKFNHDDVNAMLKGIEDEGETLIAKKVIPANSGPVHAHKLEVHLSQGRNREIRRMLESLGYRVKKLKRIQIGNFRLKGIPRGSARELKESEIQMVLNNK